MSGTFYTGSGGKLDAATSMMIPAGGMMIMQPRHHHFAWTKEETVVQLHGTGPRGITYINPADDPRKQ